jgi:hypothetical protein
MGQRFFGNLFFATPFHFSFYTKPTQILEKEN